MQSFNQHQQDSHRKKLNCDTHRLKIQNQSTKQ